MQRTWTLVCSAAFMAVVQLSCVDGELDQSAVREAGERAAPAVSTTSSELHNSNVVIGQEVGAAKHLADGQEYSISRRALFDHGGQLFSAVWTPQEGGGRPLAKGTGASLVDPSRPLNFPFNFNRVSAPDANSCAGCHNAPAAGGGGDIVANVFVLGQRFDFLTFDHADTIPQRGALQENGAFATLQSSANSRNTLGMFGSGYVEMLSRQITEDLQLIRDSIPAGASAPLVSKGIFFGVLARANDGAWDTSQVEGLTPMSLASSSPQDPPSLIIRPFHQASAVVSLREFTNNAMNHHHGMQSTERFGQGTDPDGDGFSDELSRADITAVSVWQAALPVPGRVIPRHPQIEAAIHNGEVQFQSAGCASCHIPSLPLDSRGWIYSEPNPFNPAGNLQPGDAATLSINLNSRTFPGPRLRARNGVVHVPVFTDFKLHDVTCGPGDPNIEQLNMHFPPSDPAFFAGNSRFLTKKLWGAANEPPYYHHGKYTTLRQAVLAHCGDAESARQAFESMSDYDRDSIIEFMKSLQVLPGKARSRIVDERGRPRRWRSAF